MAFKSKEEQARYHREVWYPKNKKRRIVLNHKWKDDQVALFNKWKETLKCCLCDESEACALDFHHVNPEEKDIEISKARRSWSHRRLLKEAEKCVVVCSNCHRKIHAGVVQLAEHHTCNVVVEGSIPSTGSIS